LNLNQTFADFLHETEIGLVVGGRFLHLGATVGLGLFGLLCIEMLLQRKDRRCPD